MAGFFSDKVRAVGAVTLATLAGLSVPRVEAFSDAEGPASQRGGRSPAAEPASRSSVKISEKIAERLRTAEEALLDPEQEASEQSIDLHNIRMSLIFDLIISAERKPDASLAPYLEYV